MPGYQSKKDMGAIISGIILIVVVITLGTSQYTATTEQWLNTTRTDSESFLTLNSTAVDFSLSDVLLCEEVSIYNETDSVNVTSDFTISDCEATLTNNNINDTEPIAEYIATYNNRYATETRQFSDSGIASTLLFIISIIILAIIIKKQSEN